MQETIPGVNVITAVKILAIQMVQLSSKGTPRNPVVRACYEKRKAEGKTSQQALICISRRLIFGVGTRLRTGEVNPLFGFENVIEAGLVGAGSNVYSSIRETMEEKKGKCQYK